MIESDMMKRALVGISALPGVMAWRENSGFAWQGDEMRVRVGDTVRIKPGMKVLLNPRPLRAGIPGIADIMGLGNGRAFAVEMKTLTGEHRVTQIRFERAFTKAGGAYLLARDHENAIQFLRDTVLP